jgi:hypothetical protein
VPNEWAVRHATPLPEPTRLPIRQAWRSRPRNKDGELGQGMVKGCTGRFRAIFAALTVCAATAAYCVMPSNADQAEQSDGCPAIFSNGSLNEVVLDSLADIVFPPSNAAPTNTAYQDQRQLAAAGHLMKWDHDLRLIVVGNEKPPADVLYATQMFKSRLEKTIGRDRIEIVLNPPAPYSFRSGDILLLLSRHPDEVLTTDARIVQLFRDLYGSDDEYNAMTVRAREQADLGFVDLIDVENLTPDKAAIVFNTSGAIHRRHNLFRLLTFVSSPNPNLPSRPDLVYRAGFDTEAQFDPGWNRLYRIFLVLAYHSEIKPGITRDQFIAKAKELKRLPSVSEALLNATECH